MGDKLLKTVPVWPLADTGVPHAVGATLHE